MRRGALEAGEWPKVLGLGTGWGLEAGEWSTVGAGPPTGTHGGPAQSARRVMAGALRMAAYDSSAAMSGTPTTTAVSGSHGISMIGARWISTPVVGSQLWLVRG